MHAPVSTVESPSVGAHLSPLDVRAKHRGLLEIELKLPVRDKETLSIVYTPGVAKPCLEIRDNPLSSFDITMRGNTIAVISNGSSVYGLGPAGAEAAIPMLESKSVLHKSLAGTDALPIAIHAESTDAFVETVRRLEPTFGAFHLDGLAAPQCYSMEALLKRALAVPVMHGEHSTAVTVTAALLNGLKLAGKNLKTATIVLNGAGTSGYATARLLMAMGVKNLIICDQYGLIATNRPQGMDWLKAQLARRVNPHNRHGSLADALEGADAYVGYLDNSQLDASIFKGMAEHSIVLAMALPTPEVTYEAAKAAGVSIYASLDPDSPNTLNTSMAYPGIFRGALEVKATDITYEMLISAALAIAGLVEDDKVAPDCLVPSPFNDPVAEVVARAVAQSAIEHGVAQVIRSPLSIERKISAYRQDGSKAWLKSVLELSADAGNDEKAMALRHRYQGVIETSTRIPLTSVDAYRTTYAKTKTVKVCQAIQEQVERAYELTCKGNLVAVVTDGSAVLGLGNIGPTAGMPVMEGKSVLFKSFGGVEAFPICLQTQHLDELAETVQAITPIFGGINLEDIAAPRCFELEERLIRDTDIPIFHDDQHGTAVVVVAAIYNAVKAVGKQLGDVRIAVNGAGASALSVSNLLLKSGVKDIVICDTRGIIYEGRPEGMNPYKDKIAKLTNLTGLKGSLNDAVRNADIFIGLSVPGALTQDMVRSMAKDPIVMAMANPTPEIMPDEARAAGAKIMATGRSDFPNQVNNSLAFPGIFRGVLDVQAKVINDEMKLAAARAIAARVSENDLDQGVIIPGAFNLDIPPVVAAAVAEQAIATGVARRPEVSPADIQANLQAFFETGQLKVL